MIIPPSEKKPNLASPLGGNSWHQKILKFIGYGCIALIALIYVFPWFMYWHEQREMSYIPVASKPATAFSPRLIRDLSLLMLGTEHCPIKPLTPWGFIFALIASGSPERKSSCSVELAHLTDHMLRFQKYPHQRLIDKVFGSIWVSRHFSEEDMWNTVLIESYFGENASKQTIKGYEAASVFYFKGTPLEKLTLGELALLVRIENNPHRVLACSEHNKPRILEDGQDYLNTVQGHLKNIRDKESLASFNTALDRFSIAPDFCH